MFRPALKHVMILFKGIQAFCMLGWAVGGLLYARTFDVEERAGSYLRKLRAQHHVA